MITGQKSGSKNAAGLAAVKVGAYSPKKCRSQSRLAPTRGRVLHRTARWNLSLEARAKYWTRCVDAACSDSGGDGFLHIVGRKKDIIITNLSRPLEG